MFINNQRINKFFMVLIVMLCIPFFVPCKSDKKQTTATVRPSPSPYYYGNTIGNGLNNNGLGGSQTTFGNQALGTNALGFPSTSSMMQIQARPILPGMTGTQIMQTNPLSTLGSTSMQNFSGSGGTALSFPRGLPVQIGFQVTGASSQVAWALVQAPTGWMRGSSGNFTGGTVQESIFSWNQPPQSGSFNITVMARDVSQCQRMSGTDCFLTTQSQMAGTSFNGITSSATTFGTTQSYDVQQTFMITIDGWTQGQGGAYQALQPYNMMNGGMMGNGGYPSFQPGYDSYQNPNMPPWWLPLLPTVLQFAQQMFTGQ